MKRVLAGVFLGCFVFLLGHEFSHIVGETQDAPCQTCLLKAQTSFHAPNAAPAAAALTTRPESLAAVRPAIANRIVVSARGRSPPVSV